MHPIGKIIIGVILVIGAIYYIWQNPLNTAPTPWQDFKTVVNGVVPVLVALVGLFMVWLEMDELRIERELRTEERKATRVRKRKR